MKGEVKIKDEESLLLGLCRLEFSDEHLDKTRSLVSDITDWNYFMNLANEHGVTALVWHNLDRFQFISAIPEEVVIYLRSTLMISLSRNTFNTESIGEVLRLLNAENIKTVILKGLALENSVYGNSGLRQMSDIDILIDRKDCIKARKILISNGYESLPVKSLFHEIILPYTGKHLPSLIKNGTSVEIHHELFGGKQNTLTKMLFNSSYEVEIRGEKAWFPQPQVFFLYLVRHLWVHEMNNESQLRLYTDLIVLIEKYNEEILNNNLLKYASEAGMTEVLAWHLEPLRDMWGVPFEGWLNDFIDKWHSQEFITKFYFLLSSPKNNLPGDKAKSYRQILGDIPGLHRKFLYVLGDIFPSVSFMKNRYKCKRTWKVLFYYPHRIGKIIWLFKR
jgi:Uncharacterised nucleotidyltransferase